MDAAESSKLTVVYQCFDLIGNHGWIYGQTLYSLVSLCAAHALTTPPDGVLVEVFTDKPEEFDVASAWVNTRKLEREKVLSAMGPQRFVHRLKLSILTGLVEGCAGPVLYCDGDVIFKSPVLGRLKELPPHHSLMHRQECSIGDLCRKDRQLRRQIGLLREKGFAIGQDACMYNAGVIGLHQSDYGLIPKALAFTDAACELGERHTWEQMGVSLALGQNTCIHATDDVIHHYWDQREAYSAEINRFFRKARVQGCSWCDLVEFAQQNPVMVQPYKRPSLLKRVLAKATGRSRMISIRIQDEIRRVQQ